MTDRNLVTTLQLVPANPIVTQCCPRTAAKVVHRKPLSIQPDQGVVAAHCFVTQQDLAAGVPSDSIVALRNQEALASIRTGLGD